MNDIETFFQVPLIFRALCYLGGMALFLSELIWLWHQSRPGATSKTRTLPGTASLWSLRLLAALAIVSLLAMISGFRSVEGFHEVFPELALLALIGCAFLLVRRGRGENAKAALKDLPRETLKALGVLGAALAGWAVSIALGWSVFQGLSLFAAPPWIAIFIIGLLWNGPLIALFFKIRNHERAPKFQDLLWPVLLAYLLIMLPDFAEHLANSDKIQNLLNAPPPLRPA
ncbi:MAG: hypothetical protein KDJ75_07690 [Alphaproteobacteria bacterium]|nr:hypothetical protein [Alphaproteobacteria bacterium]